MADVEFERAFAIGRAGDGIVAAAVFGQDFHILAGVKAKGRRFGQRHAHHGNVAADIDLADARRQGADVDGFGAGVGRHIDFHRALRLAAAQKNHARSELFFGQHIVVVLGAFAHAA